MEILPRGVIDKMMPFDDYLEDDSVAKLSIQQSNASADGEATAEEMAAAMLESIPADKYPNLYRMAMNSMQSGYDIEADFSFGLKIILDGLERILKESH